MLLNRWWLIVVCCIVCGGAAAKPGEHAQVTPPSPPAAGTPPSPENTPQAKSNPAAGKDAVVTAPTVPDQYRLNLLIRSTIIALNQANKTGNYSVLRDLGSPSFQSANSAARLAEIFSAQRHANLDLAPVLFFTPTLVRAPAIDADGMLRLTGFFPTQPQQVNFDLAFEFIQGEWRHFGVSVETQPVAAQTAPISK